VIAITDEQLAEWRRMEEFRAGLDDPRARQYALNVICLIDALTAARADLARVTGERDRLVEAAEVAVRRVRYPDCGKSDCLSDSCHAVRALRAAVEEVRK
jgi:hypothetical protein